MGKFALDPKLKDAILNPFFTPPPHAKLPKGGELGVDGYWDEPVTIEDWEWSVDEETGDGLVRCRVRVTGETETENQGKSHTEFMRLPDEARKPGAEANKVTQFNMSYANIVHAYLAAGNEGKPDPDDITPEEMIGAKVIVSVGVKKGKDGKRRQNISFKA